MHNQWKYNYSLIIPHYGNGKNLKRLLDSLPDRKDLQVIIIDDCSPDQITINKLINSYNNIEFYTTPSNSGAGKARNIGLDHAKGKYIIFADSDDFFTQNFNNSLEEYCNTNYDLIYFPSSCVEDSTMEKSNYLNYFNSIIISHREKPFELKFFLPYPWSKFYSHQLIKDYKIRFDETIVSNDLKFSTLYDFYSKNPKIETYPIYCYVVSKKSVSRSLSSEKLKIKLEVDVWRYNFFKNKKINKIKKRIILGSLLKIQLSGDKVLIKESYKYCIRNKISSLKLAYIYLLNTLKIFLRRQ